MFPPLEIFGINQRKPSVFPSVLTPRSEASGAAVVWPQNKKFLCLLGPKAAEYWKALLGTWFLWSPAARGRSPRGKDPS